MKWNFTQSLKKPCRKQIKGKQAGRPGQTRLGHEDYYK